ncbi:MAG: 2-hydroxyglutaryl-CoA dehydratase [Chloroflexi bacterium]|nr:2-hydroxyglutaryl-CoA dehydratase [Chloroflexota bacterium]
MDLYLGIDVGSVTAKLALIHVTGDVAGSVYLRTCGNPIAAVQQGLRSVKDMLPGGGIIRGVGTTGSARYLAAAIVGADAVKNEISSQAVATVRYVPQARTIVEIGGQDSKIIILRQGAVADFAMNTVCAAGTGSFLDHQASRLGLDIGDFGDRAAGSQGSVRISGQCTVFAESDMIQKQQMGYAVDDILYGLCQALVRNYLHNVGAGKDVASPIVFLGGVAFNRGMVRAFRQMLGTEDLTVPPHHEVMGAVGAALLAMEDSGRRDAGTRFRGFGACEATYAVSSFECSVCSSLCEIAQAAVDGDVLGRWGGRCDLWSRVLTG